MKECVGPQSDMAGKASSCEGCPNASTCASGACTASRPQCCRCESTHGRGQAERSSCCRGKRAGKSTVSTQLSFALSRDQEKWVFLM